MPVPLLDVCARQGEGGGGAPGVSVIRDEIGTPSYRPPTILPVQFSVQVQALWPFRACKLRLLSGLHLTTGIETRRQIMPHVNHHRIAVSASTRTRTIF